MRIEPTNKKIRDYFLLSPSELAKPKVKRLRIMIRAFAPLCRHETIDALYRICSGKAHSQN